MFVIFLELDTGVYQASCCKYPDAYVSKIRADFPYAEVIWCLQARISQARNIARFLRGLSAEDVEYWRAQDPKTVKRWLHQIH